MRLWLRSVRQNVIKMRIIYVRKIVIIISSSAKKVYTIRVLSKIYLTFKKIYLFNKLILMKSITIIIYVDHEK